METHITPSPLPGFESPRIQQLGWRTDSGHYRAYNNVLRAEQQVIPNDMDKVTSVRVAGFMLLEFSEKHDAFGLQASETLVNRFTSPPQDQDSNQHDVIIRNGARIRDNLFRAFRTAHTAYSQPSSYSSRESVDDLQEMIQESMKTASKSYDTSRKKVLIRDGWRCVITGVANCASLDRYPELRKQIPGNVMTMGLKIAHVFKQPTTQTRPTDATSNVFAILDMFGYTHLARALREENSVYETWNLLVLQWDLRGSFDKLDLWFERTDKPHRYKVCTFFVDDEDIIHRLFRGADREIAGAPMFVEFNSQHPEAPPPNPELLELQAICARVAHMSGTTEFFNQIEWDVEEMTVLASDGSSAPLLCNLLSPYTAIPGV